MDYPSARPTGVNATGDLVLTLALQALTDSDLVSLFRQACRALAVSTGSDVHIVERDSTGMLVTKMSTMETPTDPDELMRETDALVLPVTDGTETRRLIVHPTPESARGVAAARQVAEVLEAASQRSRRELGVKANEERLRMAQELAGLGSYDWEIASDTNTWSDELFKIYGSEPGSFNASYEKFLSFIHPDDREKIQEVHRVAFETMKPYAMEERIVRPNGEIRILKSNGVVIPDDHGNPARMTGICYDITELKAAEGARLKLHDSDLARTQALAINDSIVQGLATALGHLRLGDHEESELFMVETLAAARGMMDDLLSQTQSGRTLAAGDLVRSTPATVSGASARAAEAETDALARSDDDGPSLGSIRVVVADDTPEMRRLTRHILEAVPEVTVVGEAATGLEAIHLSGTLLPDVLILDLAMPEMDGITAIPEVKLVSPNTRILIMSGYGEELGDQAQTAGADGFIGKGASMDSLRDAVSRLGGLERA